MQQTAHSFDWGGGSVDAILVQPARPRALLVMAHGAGAGMEHPWMRDMAAGLATVDVATWRYQFPYTQAGKRAPDKPATLVATVRAAVQAAHASCPDLPLFGGGKSMGGRMTSTAQAQAPLAAVRGLV